VDESHPKSVKPSALKRGRTASSLEGRKRKGPTERERSVKGKKGSLLEEFDRRVLAQRPLPVQWKQRINQLISKKSCRETCRLEGASMSAIAKSRVKRQKDQCITFQGGKTRLARHPSARAEEKEDAKTRRSYERTCLLGEGGGNVQKTGSM